MTRLPASPLFLGACAVPVLALALACGGGADETLPGPMVGAAPEPATAEPAPPPDQEPEPEGAAPEQTQACSVGAIVADPDPAGLNVRAEPGGAVVGQIFEGAEVTVTDARDGWVQVTDVWDAERDAEWPEGWVHGSLLTTRLRTPATYGPDTQPVLREDPQVDAPSTDLAWDPAPAIEVVGCEGSFLEVEVTPPGGSPATGWLGRDSHCPATMTTCS